MIRIDPYIVLNKEILSRVKANKNFLGTLCGATGSGKSYFSIGVGERYFKDFTVDDIVFTIKEYLDRFQEMKPGSMIIFDEGESFNSRQSMSAQNVEFGTILSMIRFTQVSSIFTLPDIRQVDINLVRLMHAYMYTMDIDRRTCPLWQRTRTGINFFEIRKDRIPQNDSRDFGRMLRYPVMDVIVRNNRTKKCYEKTIKIKELWLNAPSEELLEDYEKLKRKHFNSAMAASKARLKFQEIKERNKMSSQGVDTGTEETIPQNPAPIPQPQTGNNNVLDRIMSGD
jgi:hypothetical protein